MKTFKTLFFSGLLLLQAAIIPAQTADQIIEKYLAAIGGRDMLKKVNSVYIESTVDAMGMQMPQKITILNGVGYKQEIDVMGSLLVNCFGASSGWTINPFAGMTSAENMPENQYKEGKDQIYIGAPFSVIKEKGYKLELAGNEDVKGISAAKVKLTSSDGVTTFHYFDPQTGFLIKSLQQGEMEGQPVEITVMYEDYKTVEGLMIPFRTYTSIGSMFEMNNTVTKVEINKPVDPSVFIKP
ncbi:MAG TPA: hypothetical protein PLS74_11675 [Bacteroidales bacterium]|nr:hypothetical protein [Bacteroidales bacterium]HOM41558.1 hypothetical protein [Bacteroidales bacterium]HOU31574.1 hypothetical protein [Bacteroidales bacterium]